MKDFDFPLKDFISKGLAPNDNPRNNPLLVKSIGAITYNNVLQSIEQFTRIDTSSMSGVVFPFPQIFVLSQLILICTKDEIYEYADGILVLKLGSLSSINTWDVADFKTYLYLTNGQLTVTRDPTTGVYAIDTDLPFAACVCDYNGQVLIGSPNIDLGVFYSGGVDDNELN